MYRFLLRLLIPVLLLTSCLVRDTNSPLSSASQTVSFPPLADSSLDPLPPQSPDAYPPPSAVLPYPLPATVPPFPLPSPSPALTSSSTPTVDAFDCLPDSYPPEYALVLWAVDGNTIVVDIQGRRQVVRYLGIEAPRISAPSQPFGGESKELNQALVADQVVRLVRDVSDVDRFGQLLRYVLVGEYFINYEMVRRGLAHSVPESPDLTCQALLADAQLQAEQAYLGVWALPTATRTAFVIRSSTPTLTPTSTIPSLTPTGTITPPTPTPTGTITPPTPTPTGTITPPTPTPTGTITPPTPTRTSVIVFSTQTPTPSPTITPSPTSPPDQVYIETIHYHDSSPNESLEYVQIRNGSDSAVLLQYWVLENDDTAKQFFFPPQYIQPGQFYRIYTNPDDDDPTAIGHFNWESTIPIWDNTQGCASLYNPTQLVDQYCYPSTYTPSP